MLFTILHSFVNIFAGGRSDSKVWLFLIYLLIIFSLYLFVSKYTKDINIKWKFFGITLTALYLYGFFLHIFYTNKIGVRFTDFIITGNNGEISSSTLWHTHEAKVFLGNILNYFGFSNLSTIDAGGAYLGLIPNTLVFIGSLLLVCVLIQNFLYFCFTFQKKLLYKSTRQKIFLILGYCILSFSIIKTSIDGGLFNKSLILGIVFIFLFYLQNKGLNIKKYYYLCLITSMVLLCLDLYLTNYTSLSGLLFGQTSSLILLYTIILYLSSSSLRLQFIIPIIFLFIASWWLGSVRDFDIYSYGKNIIPEGQEFYFYDKKLNNVIETKNIKNITIEEFSSKLGDNLSYLPVAVPGVTCMPAAKFQSMEMYLITDKPILKDQITKTEFIIPIYKNSIKNGNYFKTQIIISVNNCLPEILSAINGLFLMSKINTYIIVNPVFYDSTNNF